MGSFLNHFGYFCEANFEGGEEAGWLTSEYPAVPTPNLSDSGRKPRRRLPLAAGVHTAASHAGHLYAHISDAEQVFFADSDALVAHADDQLVLSGITDPGYRLQNSPQ
jgi:hypothetical protein